MVGTNLSCAHVVWAIVLMLHEYLMSSKAGNPMVGTLLKVTVNSFSCY